MSKSRYKYTETGGGPWHVIADGQVFLREDGNPKTYTKQHTALMQAEAMLEDGFRTVSITQTSEIRVELANGAEPSTPDYDDPALQYIRLDGRVGETGKLIVMVKHGDRPYDGAEIRAMYGGIEFARFRYGEIGETVVLEDVESLPIEIEIAYDTVHGRSIYSLGTHTVDVQR